MEFRYHCFVIEHASERVTVIPLEQPQFAVHAANLERATEDIELAIDDRITRAHPGRVGAFARTVAGTAMAFDLPVIPVWDGRTTTMHTLRLTGVVSPAQKPFVEVRLPRLDLRLWLESGAGLAERARTRLLEYTKKLDANALLALRAEGAETVEEITVRSKPVKLASLGPRALHLAERPFVLPDDVEEDAAPPARDPLADDEDTDAPAFDSEQADSWDEPKRGAPKKKPAKPSLPTLKRLGVALHEAARNDELDPAFERDALVDSLLARFDAVRLDAIVLVGEPGVGKTAIVHELVRRMAAVDAPEARRTRAAFHLDGSRWIAGEGFFGDWQAQVLSVLDEARKHGVLLDLGHIADLLDAGRSAHSDQNVAQLLAPALAARDIAIIGEATTEEWTQIEQCNASFARAWSVVRVDEPARDAVDRILARVGAALAEEQGIDLAHNAVSTIGALARRFWPYGSAVGSGVNLLRRFVSSMAHARKKRASAVDAIEHFSSESGIPRELLRDDITLDVNAVRAFLGARVIGQRHAIDRAADIVAVIKAGLADTRRPVATLFFAGPTGVGKTELSKALAEFVFGAHDRMVRLDMGEYAGPDALARLLGEGSGGGSLTASVRRQPFSLVLLDEIEKAHPAVFDALLGVLGEGRLSDANGRFTDFRNAIIVMTSNLGADTLRARVGFGGEAAFATDSVRKHYVAEAQRFFRPELFNRIDDFIVFAPLDAPVIRQIVEREVVRIRAREGFRRHAIAMSATPAALDLLAARGLDPRYGARPLKRTLERELVVPIANQLAAHPDQRATLLTIDHGTAGIELKSESVQAAQLGAGSALRTMLDEISALRSEIRRWLESKLVTELRHRVAFFERASREKAFWKDARLAQSASERAARSRTLIERLADLSRQAEVAEDLAFEAYYDRSADAVDPLQQEIRVLRGLFPALKIDLYASMFPARANVLLYVRAARTSWHWAAKFIENYRRWCANQSAAFAVSYLREVPPAKRANAPKDSIDHQWKWTAAEDPSNPAVPMAAALSIRGSAALLALAGEHGVHRIIDGSNTLLVRVRFEPVFTHPVAAAHLLKPSALDERFPTQEIRRIQLRREEMQDLRLAREFPLAWWAPPLDELCAAWISHLVFTTTGDAWK